MRAALLLALLLVAPAAVADPTDDPQCRPATLVIIDGRRVYQSNCAIPVPGDVQRPYAFDVSHRASRVYSLPEVNRATTPAVVEAVRRDPF
ncbi:MAG: hypothetical protein R3A52_01260 [Polyangiales bacterium]